MKITWPLFLLLFVLSCSSKNGVPDGILADSTMRNILVDISVVDAAHNLSLSSQTYPRFKPELFYEEIMKKHHTSRDEFVESLGFYAQETKRIQKIYEEAMVEVSKKQAEESE
jgi:hypothetical protein